jgi:excisionase family DNA binding protein
MSAKPPNPVPRSRAPRVITYAEAGSMLAISDESVRRLVREGELHSFRVGPNSVRLLASDVEAYIRKVARRHGGQ